MHKLRRIQCWKCESVQIWSVYNLRSQSREGHTKKSISFLITRTYLWSQRKEWLGYMEIIQFNNTCEKWAKMYGTPTLVTPLEKCDKKCLEEFANLLKRASYSRHNRGAVVLLSAGLRGWQRHLNCACYFCLNAAWVVCFTIAGYRETIKSRLIDLN